MADELYMRRALELAERGLGAVSPNPMVGCVVVNNGIIIGEGWHQKFGEAHAEVEALKTAYIKLTNDNKILNANSSSEIHKYLLNNHSNMFKGISIYTTLEPCSHVGKTPSCATLITGLGIKKLFVGSDDANHEASGGN